MSWTSDHVINFIISYCYVKLCVYSSDEIRTHTRSIYNDHTDDE